MYDKDALQGKTLAELREIGRQFGIKAQMRKQELADKILELSARQQPAVLSTLIRCRIVVRTDRCENSPAGRKTQKTDCSSR